MGEIVSFRDLDAWKVAMDLVVAIYSLAAKLPATERYELSAQIRRAAVSIPSNIAEGQAYGPGRRNLHHVRIALGSLAELGTQLEIVDRLGLLSAGDLTEVSEQLKRTGQLLHGLARSLRLKLLKAAATGSAGLILLCCLFLVR